MTLFVHCIRLNLDCADICGTTGRVLSRLTQSDSLVLRAQLRACVVACAAYAQECEMHVEEMNLPHCAVCAASCRRCEQLCERLLASMAAYV